MTLLQRFKRDVMKHRAKAAVLGVLMVVLAVFCVKAADAFRPKTAAALPIPGAAAAPNAVIDPVISRADADQRLKEGGLLWEKLREVKATAAAPARAFTFDASFYPPPLIQPEEIHPTTQPVTELPLAPVTPAADLEAARVTRIHEQAHGLVVKSTAVGNSNTQPMAIVNQQLLTVGQQIMGFEIVAIHARAVDFRKEGVPITVKMLDDPGM